MGVNSCYSTIMDNGHEYTVWELTLGVWVDESKMVNC